FTDSGLQLISDHLDNLEVLNLCETLVTSQGILCLASLKNLRIVNLNSTAVSLSDYEKLKELLPNLTDVDVKYTDADLSC
ncbi:hypothetical protein HELRODRAFT_75160, partial [Helobdella robusta]|uniref:Uncharacterized protein n=1 Tax=Helobdella robusta TaxID=6412 RepID=T1G217_HELRO